MNIFFFFFVFFVVIKPLKSMLSAIVLTHVSNSSSSAVPGDRWYRTEVGPAGSSLTLRRLTTYCPVAMTTNDAV